MNYIKNFVSTIKNSRVLYAAVLIAFVAVIGPFLVSAANTLLTLIGIALLVLLLWWGFNHVRNYLNEKEDRH